MLALLLTALPIALAGDEPEAAEERATASGPLVAPAVDPLLQALLDLHGPQRIPAIRQLGALGDPRAVPVLVDLQRDHPGGPTAEAAAHALAHFSEGTPILRSWVLDANLPRGTRIAAARALGEAASDAAGEALLSTTASRRVSGPVRLAVVDVLRTAYPGRVEAAKNVSDRGAVAWTMTGTGIGLGYGVATLGHFGTRSLEALGGAAGAAGGATAGWFYARRRPIEAGDAAFVSLAEAAGGAGGVLLAAGTQFTFTDDPSDGPWLSGLVGVTAGAGIGLATARFQQGDGRDALTTGILTGGGVATLTGAVGFAAQGGSGHDLELVAGASTLLSFGAAAAAAPHLRLHGTDAGFVALGTAWGALGGGFLPLPARTSRFGLPLATAGVAGLTAWGLSPTYDAPADDLLGGALGFGAGAVTGTGVLLLADPDADPGWGVLTGSTLGGVAGIALADADPAENDGTDMLWGGLATGWVAWQALGWLGDAYSGDRAVGIALTAIGGAGSASAVASRWASVPYAATLTMGSTALWGTYIGVTGAHLTDGDALRAGLIGGDVGLAVGAVALVPRFQIAPVVVGLADGGGVLVGGTATVIAGLITKDGDALLAASLIGAGLGTTGGALVGLKLDRRVVIGLALPKVDPPGVWGVQPLVGDADGTAVYGATLTGRGW